LGAVLVLNLLFLLANLWVASLPTEPLADRVRAAFAAGDLTTDDVAVHDTRRGISQYNDCLILQMLLNDGQTALEKATGPLLQVRDETYSGYCAALHDVATGADTSGYTASYTYTRYWHGYMPLTATAWVQALRLARRSPVPGALPDLLAFAAAAVIAAWILLLPVHARAHPWMSRILIVPIALGFAALAWQWQLRSQSRRDRAAEGPAQP
jgi:hypothetical protein